MLCRERNVTREYCNIAKVNIIYNVSCCGEVIELYVEIWRGESIHVGET